MLIRLIGIGASSSILPLLVGMLYTSRNKENANSILKNWASGMIICLGLFELLAVPFTYLKRSLTQLSYVYMAVIVVLCIGSLIINRKRLKTMVLDTIQSARHIPWIAIIPVLIIAFQMYMYVDYVHVDEDDAFYVATATTSVSTNTLFQFNPYSGDAYSAFPSRYVLSPFPLLIAMISKLSGFHTLIFAHTILPLLLLPLSYAVFTLFGDEIFKKDRQKTAYFMLFVSVIQMFAFTSTHTQGTVLLLRIWQGKAVLASILLPFAFYLCIRLIERELEKSDWILLFFVMLACCMVSSMGIMLGAIMLGILGLLALFYKKDIRILFKIIACCIPNLLLSCIYLLIR